MKRLTMRNTCVMLIALAIAASTVCEAKKEEAASKPLTEAGQKLEAQYAEQLEQLKQKILQALPKVAEQKKAAYFKAVEDEKAAKAALAEAQKNFSKIHAAQGAVNHAKGKWIGGADRGIAQAKAKLDKATTEAERKAAQEELAKWQKNREDGVQALKERQAKLDAAKREEPRLKKELEEAEEALAQAKADALKAFDELGLKPFLASDQLDDELATFLVLFEATPKGLAAFAEQGEEQDKLVKELLADTDLMIQMAVADGANGSKYGRAMSIYNDIQKAGKKAGKGALQRLALAISLEHAVPIGQRNPKAEENAPATVDPVKRYLHYEKAFLNGELDPAFADLSVWDYRMVVDGSEPDETLAWGREMLRSYRPDHVSNPDYRWRYVGAVRTDIRYGSQYNKYDKPELQFFQNILMNGGICGRRAFFGRFILRAFGIPTTARPQRGHAALAHWTPDGWVVCLGAGWGSGWTKGRYDRDLDFLANTQARESEDFLQVKRAQWIGDVEGEKRVFGLLSGTPDFWYGASLYRQRQIIEEAKAVALAAVGEELGEANESDVDYETDDAAVTEEDRKIEVDKTGVITIPAAACSKPTGSTRKILFMNSNLGGKQLHYNRTGGAENFEYTFEAPKAGEYELTARLISPSWGQHLLVASNGAKEPIDIELPLTVGLWDTTEPVKIKLDKGKNVLTFSRGGDNIRGLTIKDFTLTPVAN